MPPGSDTDDVDPRTAVPQTSSPTAPGTFPVGLGALTACAVLALTHVVDDWLAALIVGAAELVIAGVAALIGRSRMKRVTPLVPEESVRSVRADVEAVKPHREVTP